MNFGRALPLGIRVGTWLFRLFCVSRIVTGISASAAELRQDASYLPVLTNVSQVRQMSPEEAERGHHVHLQGVVTYCDEKFHGIFFHNDGGGIYVPLPPDVRPEPGDVVEVEGLSGAGKFAPIVRASQLEILGHRLLPPAKPVTYDQLATGREDSQWVEICGVVRSVTHAEESGLYLDIAMTGGRIRCFVHRPLTSNADWLVNATVRVRGACFCRFTDSRQLRAPWLGLNSLENVQVEKPAPPEPALMPVSGLLRFNSEAVYGERVKVRGVVTLLQKNGSLYLEEDHHGLHVKTLQGTPVNPGDIVEVLGFPVLGQFRPALEDAIYRRVGNGRTPDPFGLSAEEALKGRHDADLVRIEGRLLNRVKRGDEQLLVLKADNLIFSAQLTDHREVDALASLRNGSQVALTGVCVVQEEENWNPSASFPPESFRVLLHEPGDIVVLHQAPWWTLSRLLWTSGALVFLAIISMAWVIILRRRVREQTEIIQQKVQRESVLEERNRIAREFHDTLEQELAAITLQLDAAAAQFNDSPSAARRFLELARTMSRRSFAEVRRSVWDLRSHFLEMGDLPTAFDEIIKPLATRTDLSILVHSTGRPRRLPSQMENHLLRIGQEAVTNAVKHARARNIRIELNYEPRRVRLRVCDDGCGFDVATSPGANGAHFGLLDMRERAEKLGCRLRIGKPPTGGTEIIAEVEANSSTTTAGTR